MGFRNNNPRRQGMNIKLPNGKMIKRVPTGHSFGNFNMLTIRYNKSNYLIGDGDEYLRGYPKYFKLDLSRKVK